MDPNQFLGGLATGSDAGVALTNIAINLFNLVVGVMAFFL